MNIKHRLYFLTFVSSLGSWLTFLAMALLIKEKFGGNNVSFAFLIQSLGPLLLSNFFAKIIKPDHQYRWYMASLILSATNVAALVFSSNIYNVYLYLVIASVLGAFNRPLLLSLISEWVEKKDLTEVHTRVGAIQAALLALAPPLGGMITTYFGFEVLFIFDALTFVIAAIILLPKPKVLGEKKQANKNNEEAHVIEKRLPLDLRRHLYTCYVFLGIGATLNALEFHIFEIADFSRSDIGLVIGAWGVGAIFAMLMGSKVKNTATVLWATILSAAFITFNLSSIVYLSCVAFVFGSLSNSILGGRLRANIQNEVPEGVKTLSVWTLVNKRLSLINIIFYGGIGFLLPHVNYLVFVCILVAHCDPPALFVPFTMQTL